MGRRHAERAAQAGVAATVKPVPLLCTVALLGCAAREPAPPPEVEVALPQLPASVASAHPPEPPPAPPPRASYEDALADAAPSDDDAGPELTNGQLLQPMRSPTFLTRCGVPEATHVTVKMAIRGGGPVGVTVLMSPEDPALLGCVEDALWALTWPPSPRLDSFVTTY